MPLTIRLMQQNGFVFLLSVLEIRETVVVYVLLKRRPSSGTVNVEAFGTTTGGNFYCLLLTRNEKHRTNKSPTGP